MQSIKKSECPKELEPADRRTSVHVNLIRRNENCPVSPLLMIYHCFTFCPTEDQIHCSLLNFEQLQIRCLYSHGAFKALGSL